MIFIDSSAYLSQLFPHDTNHQKAQRKFKSLKNENAVTSLAVLGEVLTVGSQRFNRQITIEFVEAILSTKTTVIYESKEFSQATFELFKKIPNKNIGWVDCYSAVIMKKYQISEIFTFDSDFKKLL